MPLPNHRSSILLFLFLGLCAALGGWFLFRSAEDESQEIPRRLVQAVAAGDVPLDVRSSWNPDELRQTRPSAGVPPTLLETFDEAAPLEERWTVVSKTSEFPTLGGPTPGAVDRELPSPQLRGPDGERHLVFPGPEGGLGMVLPCWPDTPYELRARGFAPQADGDILSAAFIGTVIAFELRPKSPEIPQGRLSTRFEDWTVVPVAPHTLELRGQGGELQENHLVFKTSVYTEYLMISVLAGVPGHSIQGEVGFDDIRVTPLPLRHALPFKDIDVSDDTLGLYRDHDFVTVLKLLGDLRDSFLAPPSTTLRVGPFRLPPRPELTFGYGLRLERRDTFGRSPVDFRVNVIDEKRTSQELFSARLDPSKDPLESLGWHEARCDLAPWASQEITLVFETEAPESCRDMAAFGAVSIVEPRPLEERPPSVILVSLDTLRADHLGLYGYERPTSPFMDRFFQEEGAALSDFTAASPYTLPSHASIFTGLHPSVHGVQQFDRRLSPEVHPHLGRLLGEQGYATAAFTGGGFVSYEYGFRWGFDIFSIVDPLLTDKDRYRDNFPRRHDRAFNDFVYDRYDLDRVLDYITDHREQPFFLFLHSFVVHNYAPPPELGAMFDEGNESTLGYDLPLHEIDVDPARRNAFTEVDLQHALNYYDATIRVADRAMETLVEHLRSTGLLDHTVLLITSDHGEEFREHGGLLHGRTLYQDQTHIPLLIRLPGDERPRGLVEGFGHHIDIAPTVLEALDLPPDPRFYGQSLLSLLSGEDVEPLPQLSELDAANMGEKTSLRWRQYKLIATPGCEKSLPSLSYRCQVGEELYDLSKDPTEQVDISSNEEVLTRMIERMKALRGDLQQHKTMLGEQASAFELSPEAQERLKQLGYTISDQ